MEILIEEELEEFDESKYVSIGRPATEMEKQKQLEWMMEICKGLPDIDGPAYTEKEFLKRLSD